MDIKKIIQKIYISRCSLSDRATDEILQNFAQEKCEIIDDDTVPAPQGMDPKQVLWLTHSRGGIVKGCPGTEKSYLCCRYQVINHTMNCPLNCTYCILQFYLNQPATVIYTNFDEIAQELRNKLSKQPNQIGRAHV